MFRQGDGLRTASPQPASPRPPRAPHHGAGWGATLRGAPYILPLAFGSVARHCRHSPSSFSRPQGDHGYDALPALFNPILALPLPTAQPPKGRFLESRPNLHYHRNYPSLGRQLPTIITVSNVHPTGNLAMYIAQLNVADFRQLKNIEVGPFNAPSGLGELIVLAGPNGSGKSSVLELLFYGIASRYSWQYYSSRRITDHSFAIRIGLSDLELQELRQDNQPDEILAYANAQRGY